MWGSFTVKVIKTDSVVIIFWLVIPCINKYFSQVLVWKLGNLHLCLSKHLECLLDHLRSKNFLLLSVIKGLFISIQQIPQFCFRYFHWKYDFFENWYSGDWMGIILKICIWFLSMILGLYCLLSIRFKIFVCWLICLLCVLSELGLLWPLICVGS